MHALLQNVATMTPEQAAEVLAIVRVKGTAALRQKQANDMLQYAGIGSAIGAGALGLHGLLRGKRRKSIGRSMLAGALAGGGLGAGLGSLGPSVRALANPIATPPETADAFKKLDPVSRLWTRATDGVPEGAGSAGADVGAAFRAGGNMGASAIRGSGKIIADTVSGRVDGAGSIVTDNPDLVAAAVLPTAVSELHRSSLDSRLKRVNQARQGLTAMIADSATDPRKAKHYNDALNALTDKYKIDTVTGAGSRLQVPWGGKFRAFDRQAKNDGLVRTAINRAQNIRPGQPGYAPPIGLKPGMGRIGRVMGKSLLGPLTYSVGRSLWEGE